MKILHRDPRKETFLYYFRIPLLILSVLLLLLIGLHLGARLSPPFAEWYTVHIYPFFVSTIGRFCSLAPFSVFEWFIAALILYLILGTVLLIRRLRRNSEYLFRKRITAHAIGRFLCILLSVLLLYTLTCGINYHRQPFSSYSGLTIRKSDNATLVALGEIITDQLCTAADPINVSETGITVVPDDFCQTAVAAMHTVGQRYPQLAGYYPQPKPLLTSVWFSYQNISGIYSPFTVEANFNADMVGYNIPFTACHELSHLRGFMREDEANFIAYLACISSEDPYFVYSGSMLAFIYVSNALGSAGESEAQAALWNRLPAVVLQDLEANNEYWARFETKIAEISDAVNDAYLKGNAQTDGVRSYGRLVDLLIAYYLPENGYSAE